MKKKIHKENHDGCRNLPRWYSRQSLGNSTSWWLHCIEEPSGCREWQEALVTPHPHPLHLSSQVLSCSLFGSWQSLCLVTSRGQSQRYLRHTGRRWVCDFLRKKKEVRIPCPHQSAFSAIRNLMIIHTVYCIPTLLHSFPVLKGFQETH